MADRPTGPSTASTEPTPDDARETPELEPAQTTRHRPWWREFPILVAIAVVLAIAIKTFLIQAFYIPSPSMVPTLQVGDRILVCRVCLHVSDIERGDILVFSDPNPTEGESRGIVGGFLHWLGEGVGVAQPQDEDFIKRVAALPGETWEIRGGELFIDGERIDEPYLNEPADTRNFGPETVPPGMLFMLGDNRLSSGDSRFSPAEGGLGYVPIDTVIGKAFVIIWPPSRMGLLH